MSSRFAKMKQFAHAKLGRSPAGAGSAAGGAGYHAMGGSSTPAPPPPAPAPGAAGIVMPSGGGGGGGGGAAAAGGGAAAPPPVYPFPPPPSKRPRYSVQFVGETLGLRLEKHVFDTRGAYVTGFNGDSPSKGGLARDIRVGDLLVSVNDRSLLLPSLDAIIAVITAAARPANVLFERVPANLAGFAALVRKGQSGMARFLDFVIEEAAYTDAYARRHLPATLFYLHAQRFPHIADPAERYRFARWLFVTFLSSSPRGPQYVPPSCAVRPSLRDNVQEILGLVKSRLLLEIPADTFEEATCDAAKHLATLLSAFCKSKCFEMLKTRKAPFAVSLREHIVKSTRALNFFLCYLLQTREHAALLCYLDAARVSRRVGGRGAGGDATQLAQQVRRLHHKFCAEDAPLPVAAVDPAVLDAAAARLEAVARETDTADAAAAAAGPAEEACLQALADVQEACLAALETGPARRFAYSSICAALVGPSDESSDLSNMIEVAYLAQGMESYRRPPLPAPAVDDDEGPPDENAEADADGGGGGGGEADLLGLGEAKEATRPASGEAHPKPTAPVAVEAAVLFEARVSDGRVRTLDTLRGTGRAGVPPNVDAFYIPHGVASDLDFQETNGGRQEDASAELFPGAFCTVLRFAPPGGASGRAWTAAVLVCPQEPATTIVAAGGAAEGDDGDAAAAAATTTTTAVAAGPVPVKKTPAGVALFSQDDCACRLRDRLAAFASKALARDEAAGQLSLHESVVQHQASLLAPLPVLGDGEDDMSLFLRMTIEALPPSLLVEVFKCAVLERKILLTSSSYTLLTAAGATLKRLIRPLSWQHVCIPVLPRQMLETLECPTPFIIGLHKSYAFRRDFPFVLDLVVVDLDRGTVQVQSANTAIEEEAVEQQQEQKHTGGGGGGGGRGGGGSGRRRKSSAGGDVALSAAAAAVNAPPSRSDERLVQDLEAALRPLSRRCDAVLWGARVAGQDAPGVPARVVGIFATHVAEMLRGASECWIPLSDGNRRESLVLFDERPFLVQHPEDERLFLKALVKTGAFSRFVTDQAGISCTWLR